MAAPHDHAHEEAPFEFPIRPEEEKYFEGHDCCAAGFPDFSPIEPLPPVATPELLFRADARFALGAGSSRAGESLIDFARFAVRLGVAEARALALITSEPARILGLDGSVGTVAKGRDADLVIFDGDPLLPTSAIRAVVVDGVLSDFDSRGTE
jgi:hypothetical protein